MGQLSSALAEMIPDLFEPELDEAAKGRLRQSTRKISELGRSLTPKIRELGTEHRADPTLPFMASLLQEDFQRASESFQRGQIDYGRAVMRSAVASCVACHTRTDSGPKFPLLSAFQAPLERVPFADRISLLIATRQFDSAIDETLARLKDSGPRANGRTLDLERASRRALGVAVRVRQSPELARKVAEAVRASAAVPESQREAAEKWLGDIKTWELEAKGEPKTEQDRLAAAKRLMGDGPDSLAAGQEVRALRASAELHALLGASKDEELRAEALYLLGVSYDQLRDSGAFELQDTYYRICIRSRPHSAVAGRCFKRFEENIIVGYTGSRGTDVPGPIARQLNELRRLAVPKGGAPKAGAAKSGGKSRGTGNPKLSSPGGKREAN
jgi:hypothetical protein